MWTSVPADDASSLAFLPSCGFSLCGPSLPPGAGSGPVLLVAPLPLPLPALPTGGEGAPAGPPRFALVLHGGAGTIERRRMTPEVCVCVLHLMLDGASPGPTHALVVPPHSHTRHL